MPPNRLINPIEIELDLAGKALHNGWEGTVVKGKFAEHDVAVKRFAIRSAHSVSRFDKEALILELDSLKNIVRPLGIVRSAPHYWLVLSYFAKGDLGKFSRSETRITLPLALLLCLDAAEALASVHEAGLVFRDFKSANILINDEFRAQLTDFGSIQDAKKGIEKDENEMGPTGGFHKRKQERSNTIYLLFFFFNKKKTRSNLYNVKN